MNETRNETLPDDPRVTPDLVRRTPSTGDLAGVTLVGVVHDHPSSIARVRHVVRAVEPDQIALELPPLAVPLFEGYAANGDATESLGGEMSAALAAASDAHGVGIDGPNLAYVGMLWRATRSRDVSARVTRDLARSLRTAVESRLAAAVNAYADTEIVVHEPVEHDSSAEDAPGTQAAAERRHLSRSAAVHGAFEPPEAVAVVDDVRERSMAAKLARLRTRGETVAVVGVEHLDAVSGHLADHRDQQARDDRVDVESTPARPEARTRPQKLSLRCTLSSILSMLDFRS